MHTLFGVTLVLYHVVNANNYNVDLSCTARMEESLTLSTLDDFKSFSWT